jgi:hypothetical protein
VQPARSTITLAGSQVAALTDTRDLYEARSRYQALVVRVSRLARAGLTSLFMLTVVLVGQAAVRPF